MVTIVGTEIPVPSFDNFGGINLPSLVIIGTIFLFFLIGAGIIYYVFVNRLYNRKIVVYENISGQGYTETWRDTARVVKIGDGGEELLFLKKKKVYRTAYGKKMGKNLYWFAIGQDGYWYNSVLGDLDAKMGMLDIEPVDRDMRLMHVAVRKNIQERYRKIKFMEKYGTIVFNGIFLIIMLIGLGFLLNQMTENSQVINEGLKTAKEIMVLNGQITASLDNICTGGAGIIAA